MWRQAVAVIVAAIAALAGRSFPAGDILAQAQPTPLVAVSPDWFAYPTGAVITFTLRVSNPGMAALALRCPNDQDYDFYVTTADARQALVWRWSDGHTFLPCPTTHTLAPGQTLTFSEVWDQRDTSGGQVPPGNYSVTGQLTTSPPVTTRPVPFTITAPPPAPPPTEESVALAAGCNNVALTWPDDTAARTVTDAVTPASAVISLWRYDAVQQRFAGYAPRAAAASDLTTVNRLDAVFLCVSVAAHIARPAQP